MQEIKRFLVFDQKDDVMVSLERLSPGDCVNGVNILDYIPTGHKDVNEGQPVHRYGQLIGFAKHDIHVGQHVHIHNLEYGEFARDYRFCEDYRPTSLNSHPDNFMGIVRPDGRIATRNYIGVLTSVNCAATVAHAVADCFRRDISPEALEAYPNIDGVVALTHSGGCGIDPTGEGLQVLKRTIAGYAIHPNFAGVVIIGLGCETNQIENLMKSAGLEEGPNLRTFTIQDVGGTQKAIQKGVSIVRAMLPYAGRFKRSSVSISHLKVGMQCGGSDSFSGVTANPVLGAAMDTLVQSGGTAILSETPEIYGAEHLLTCRAVNRDVGQKLVDIISRWKGVCERNNASLNNNPSTGNKVGG